MNDKQDLSDIIYTAHFSSKKVGIISNLIIIMNEHIKSFLITFVVAVAMVLVANIDNLTLASFEDGALFGILFASVRAGVKAVLQLVISKYSDR